MWTQPKDLTGQRFGKLMVIERAPHTSSRAHWLCLCDCGHEAVKNGKYLLCGDTRSCGCDQRAMRAGGNPRQGLLPKQHPREYGIWRSMKSRCYTPSAGAYQHYGGRGIAVCDEWRDDFGTFLRDMGQCPDGYTLDRIDPDFHYSPLNCRWATWTQQGRNKRDTVRVTVAGETMPLADAAERFGVKYDTLHHRVRDLGESADEAIQPVMRLPWRKSRRPRP